MQPVRAFSAKDAQRHVQRHVVLLVALDANVASPHFGLHSVWLW